MLRDKLVAFGRNIWDDKKKRRILIVSSPFALAVIALLVFFAIKFYDNLVVDQSFLTDKPCKAPCWYGLVPGLSTDKDILQKLPAVSAIDARSIARNEGSLWPGTQPHMISFNCKNIQKTECGFLIVTDGLLKFINLDVQYNLQLSQVVQKIGPPVYIDYYHDIINPPKTVLVADMSWPKNLIVVSAQIDDAQLEKALLDGGKLPQNLAIHEIYYVDPQYFIFGSPGERMPWPGTQ